MAIKSLYRNDKLQPPKMIPLVNLEDFIDRLLEIRRRLARFPRPSTSRDWPEGFPSPSSLKEILQAAFYASLEQYEGRTIRTVLQWTHPAFGRTYVHKLASPTNDFSAKNMRQLAQVADGTSTNLGLLFESDHLVISGIEFCWPMRGVVKNDGFVSGIKISIKGPGHIEYQEGSLAVCYKKGRQIRLRPLHLNPALKSWIDDAQSALEQRAISSLKTDSIWGSHTNQPRFPDGIVLTFLCSALRTIENGGHGGTMLILPSPSDAKAIDLRFPAISSDLEMLVRRFGEASLLASKYNITKGSLSSDLLDDGSLMSTVEAYGVAFANLSNCDGAVVMTRDAQLLGFGGIIQSPISHSQGNRLSQSRGARHTSAQWLCESIPGAIALVVSADRGITIIHSVNGNTEVITDFVVW